MTAGEESNIETEQSMISTQKVIIFVIFSVVVFAAVGLYGQIGAVVDALASIPWWWILPAMIPTAIRRQVMPWYAPAVIARPAMPCVAR